MRRAAVFALRTARRSATRKLAFKSPLSSLPSHVLRPHTAANLRRYSSTSAAASMRYPKAQAAIVGTLGAIGAWYAYSPRSFIYHDAPSQTRGVSTAASSFQTASTPKIPDRKALVVDNDQFFTGKIQGEGPLAKDTDDYGRKILEMMTPDQATERLRRNEESYLVGRGRGVVRYDLVQLPSNDPIEDDHAEKIVEVKSATNSGDDSVETSDWMFWGVFDGHSGWTTSAKLRQALISFAARELNSTYKAAQAGKTALLPPPEAIDQALKSAFVKLDDEICIDSVNTLSKNPSKRLAAEILAPALSGSCALLSFYDSKTKTLRVACTGDSRAVLGRRNTSTGKWYATPLSEDQTGSNPNEEQRMRAQHPGEEYVIHRGRVLGNLEPTRAFGDAVYKWSRETQDKIKKHFFGRTPHQLLKTPPYVTAEPVVTRTEIQPSRGDFLVMATDGLWEMLTNEEVVGLVGQWIESQNQAKQSQSWYSSWFGSSTTNGLPVEKGGNMDKTGRVDAKGDVPIRQQQWNSEQSSSRFVVEDKNVATHLVRNALGGKDRDMVCALLTLPSPYSRRYRDDLTVQVIFFGDGEMDGKVVMNAEASGPLSESGNGADGLKAKL